MDFVKTVVLLIATAIFLSACSQPLPEETHVVLEFKVAQNINPDDRQRPSPLVISVFELKTPDTFQQSDFFSLYEHPAEQLSADLVSKRKLRELVPGIDRTDNFNLNSDTRYVGILAEFAQYQQAKARLIVPVKQKIANRVVVELSGTELKWVHEAEKEKTQEGAELQPVRL